jgi:regulatory protein
VRCRRKRRKRLPPKNSGQGGLRARALTLLARREHSRLELERKLSPHAQSAEELASLLDDLVQCGWLSEQRVIEQVVHARRGKLGSRRIRQELLDKGIAAELVAEALAQLKDGEVDAARALWQKKFGSLPHDAAGRARQVRFMQGRGFALEVILKVMRQGGKDDDE